jgi:hypothetical protein
MNLKYLLFLKYFIRISNIKRNKRRIININKKKKKRNINLNSILKYYIYL